MVHTNNQAEIQFENEDYQLKEKEILELLSATKTILESNDFRVTAKKVFSGCAKLIGAKAGYVALLSDDGLENELLFLEDGGMNYFVNPVLPMPIRKLQEKTYKTGRVVYNNNFMKSDWIKYLPEGQMALPNVLFSPLNIDGKTVGIMGYAGKGGDFTDNDSRIATAFGSYAAIALKNSQTLEGLIASNKVKNKLFSIIAHDLRAPFNSLLAASKLLKEEMAQSSNQKINQYTAQINNVLEKTYLYVNNMLEWSRFHSNKIKFLPETFSLLDLVNEVTGVISIQAQNKNIHIKQSIPKRMTVFADKNLIKIVFINLLSNAIKFSHSGDDIFISGKKDGKNDIIYIKDSGIGISNEKREKLFGKEESISNKGTYNENGSGLGLEICKDFIKLHHGKINVESKLGEGSTFWFSIPSKMAQ